MSAALGVVLAPWMPARAQEPRASQERPVVRRPEVVDPRFLRVQQIEVPSVVGQSLERAREILEEHRLGVGEVTKQPSAEAAGVVVRQEPASGTVVVPPATVHLVVSSGPPPSGLRGVEPSEGLAGSTVEVHVLGARFNRFSRIFVDGLESGPIQLVSPREVVVRLTIPAGAPPGPRDVVHRWQPETLAARLPPGVEVLEGGFRVLPAPPLTVEVPSVVGRSREEALELLAALRLGAGEVLEVAANEPSGMVVRQAPAAGTRVDVPSTVALWVSRRPESPAVDLALLDPRWRLAGDGSGRVEVEVVNDGTAAARDVTVLAESLAPELEWSYRETIDLVRPGGVVMVPFSLSAGELAALGTVMLRVQVDPENRIRESLEANNTKTLLVEGPGRSPAPPPIEPKPDGGRARRGWPAWVLPAVLGALVAAALAAAVGSFVFRRSMVKKLELRRMETKVGTELTKGLPDEEAGVPESGEAPKESVDVRKEADAGVPPPPLAEPEPVRFSVFHAIEVHPDDWHELLVYVHLPSAENAVVRDSRAMLGRETVEYDRRRGKASRTIQRGTEIVVVPEMRGFRFNPRRASVLWEEDWHRVPFKMQARGDDPEIELGVDAQGTLSFFVGPILIGEVGMHTFVADRDSAVTAAEPERAEGVPYRKIFPSYSRRDTAIVDALKKAYVAIGDSFLKDVDTLRSGEAWAPRLLELIDQADVFQLYWSHNSRSSEEVEKEWRHALDRRIPQFIRPLYWEQARSGEERWPDPPRDLAGIEFTHIELPSR